MKTNQHQPNTFRCFARTASFILFITALAAILAPIPALAAAPAANPADAARFALDYPEANWGPKTAEVAVQGAFTNEQIKQFILDALKYAKMETENTGPSLVTGSYKRGGVKYPAYIKYDTAHVEIYVNADRYSANLTESIRRSLVKNFQTASGNAPVISSAVTEISTPAQLAAINKDAAGLRGNYLLMNDITVDNWTPIGDEVNPFHGIFDGNGHTITLLHFHANPNVSRATYATVSIGLFGTTAKGSLIKNLRVAGDLSYDSGATTLYMGAIAGENNGTISCCVSTAGINARGGRLTTGNAWLKTGMEQAMNAQLSTKTQRAIVRMAYQNEAAAGGIAGMNKNQIENCYATGPVTVVGEGCKTAGGIAGRNGFGDKYRGGIKRCYATGNITAKEDAATRTAGGITGLNMNGGITDCVALNAKLETIGKRKGVFKEGIGIGISNLAYGVIGQNTDAEPNSTVHDTTLNAYYRSDMTMYMEADDETEKTDKSKSNNILVQTLNGRGEAIDYAATQTKNWWMGAKIGVTFAFGNDEAAPWTWDAGLKRPILFWETPSGKQTLYNAASAKPRATAAVATTTAAAMTSNAATTPGVAGSAGGGDKFAPNYPEANWGAKSCTVDAQDAHTSEQVRQAILETLRAYRWVVESNNDGLIIGSYQRGTEKYPVYVKYDSRHADIYVNAGKNSKGWAENLRRGLDKKLNSSGK